MLNQTMLPVLVAPVSEGRDHIQGPADAAFTLVEYGDYECPHCYRAHFILRQLVQNAGAGVRLVFRHFPLSQTHPRAQRAAESAEAAAAQGKFWEMHDTLFEHQDALEDEDLLSYADEIQLDVKRFRAELAGAAYAGRVRKDFLTGVRSGVNGTPTFFNNGRRHDGAWDLESLTEAIVASANGQAENGDHFLRSREMREGQC